MKHDDIRSALQDFLDGRLDAEASRAVEEHLEGCDECRGELEQTRRLLERAARLRKEIPTERDLWPEIALRMEDERRGSIFPFGGRRRVARVLVTAAAAVLVILAVGRQIGPHGRSARLPGGLHIEMPADSDATAFATIQTLEAQCLQGDADVRALAEAGSESPEGAGTLLENLRIIDAAIDHARSAWSENPRSGNLARLLIAAYRAKVSLQVQASEMVLTS